MKRFLLLLILILASIPLYAVVVDKIVATVNGEPVTLSELERILQPVYRQYEHAYKGEDLREFKKRARRELLDQLIENKLILQKAKQGGVGITEAVMEEELAGIRDKFGSMKEFEKALQAEGLSLEQYKKDLTDQLTVRAMIEREVVSKAKISPEQVETYYKEHKDEFVTPEMVDIGHILIKDNEEKIQDIYKRLTLGEDFSELAEQYSKVGNPGFIPVGKLKPDLKEIVNSLKVGEYSKIIKTDIGWHIIQLKGKKAPEVILLKDIWDRLENKLFREKLNEEHEKWISRLKSKSHIIIEE